MGVLDEIDLHDEDEIRAYLTALSDEGKSRATIDGYFRDLRHFGRWYRGSTGEIMVARAVCPHEIAAYKAYLRTTLRRAPGTITRRLAALGVGLLPKASESSPLVWISHDDHRRAPGWQY